MSPSVSIDEVLMKKTSLFLVVLLWVVSSSFAAGEKYFCIERPMYTSGVLKLSQVDEKHVYTDPSDSTYIEELDDWGYPVTGARCYKKWYDPKAEEAAATSGKQFYDARSLLLSEIVADANSSGSGVISIYLKSDLDFGGLKADSSACVNDFKPLSLGGSDIPDGVAVFFLGVSGDYETDVHTIKNFCYIADASSGEFRGAGFFSEVSNGSHVHSLNFENSYVRVENQDQASGFPVGTVAGVADLGGTYSSEVLVNVKIKNGTVIGAVAGGFVGQVYSGEYYMRYTDLKAEGLKVYLTKDVFSNPDSPELMDGFVALGGFVGSYDASLDSFNEPTNSSDKVSYVEIKNLDVQNKVANIRAIGMSDPVTAYIGGLFGVSTLGNYDLVDDFILQGNLASVSSSDAVGYLAGGLALPSDGENYIKTGYYYGKSAAGKSLAGKFFAGEELVADAEAYFAENANVDRVYRNAVGGLETTGNIRQDGMIVDPSTGEEVRSFGVLSETDMKSGTFAFALDQYNNQWTWGESLAEGLPEFASGENLPIRRVILSVNPNVSLLLPNSIREEIEAHGEEFDGYIEITFYTDNTGKITDSFAKTIESIPGFAWFSGDGDFNASQLFEEAGQFYLNVDKPVVVAPRVLKADASDIWTEADLLKIESNAVGELTGYFGLVPDTKANIYNEGTGDVYTLQNFTEPVVYYANERGVQNWGLMYVAMKVDDEIKYALVGEGSLKDALSRSILSTAAGSTVGDTLYLVYSQNGAPGKVTFYGDGYEKVQYLGYEAGNLKKVAPIGPATVLTSTEAYENGLAHAYKFEGIPDAGYHIDRLDITIEFLSHYGASSSSFATEGYASDGTLFGSVHDLKKKLDAAGGGGTWYFSLFTTDTLVMDSLFAVYDYFKASGENPIMKISVQANPEANYYEIEFATFTEKKPFYAENWYDDYESWRGKTYLSVQDTFTYPAMYMIGEDGEYHYYNEWSLGKGDYVGSRFIGMDISYYRTDTVNVMYPQYNAGYDIYSTTVKLYRDETGAFTDDRASLELWQIIGSWEKQDTVSHEFTVAADGSGDKVIEVPLIDMGIMDFTIGVKPHGDYVIDSVRVLRELNDGSGAYEESYVLMKGGRLTVEQGVNLALDPFFRENRTYHVAYDLKLEGDVIPYVSVYDIFQESFRTEDEVMALPRIYRTDACFSGWLYDSYEAPIISDDPGTNVMKLPAEDAAEGAPSDSPMEGLFELYYMLVEAVAPNDSIETYALWKPPVEDGYGDCSLDNKKVYYLDDSVATITLTQTILGVDYVTKLNSEGTLIPNVDGGMVFVLNVHPYEGYVVDDSVTMVMMDEKESKGERPRRFAVGDTIVLPGWGGDISFTGGFKKAPAPDPLTTDSLPRFSDSTMLFVSGNAYQFRYGIENCGEEQDVRFDMALMAEGDTDKVEMTLGAEEACSGTIEDYPLLSGSYTLKAEVYVEGHKDSASVFTQTFTVESVIASAGVDSWQMLGLDAVETDSVVMDDDVRFFWWNESKSYGEFWQYYSLTDLTQFERGRGYWYSSLEGRTLPLKDSVEIPKDGFKLAWSLDSLYSGWNLVSNPFGWEISLGVSDDDEVTFWRWNAETSEYERATTVRPYEALWAKVAEHKDWTLDTKPVFVAQDSVQDSLQKSLSKATTEKEWSIRAVLSDHNGKRDSWNVLGVGARNVAWEEPPAGMGNHVNLSIMDGKRSLAKSVKTANASKVTTADNAYEWQVELSASTARMGYLSFEGLDAIGKLGYRVFVTVDGFTQEVAAGSAVEVPLTSLAKTATVRVAAEPRKTLTYALGGLRMVQSGNLLNVTFMASDGLAGSGLTVEVLDLKGKVVARTVGNAVSGANSATLTAPAGGLYMLRVRAGSAQTSGKIVVK